MLSRPTRPYMAAWSATFILKLRRSTYTYSVSDAPEELCHQVSINALYAPVYVHFELREVTPEGKLQCQFAVFWTLEWKHRVLKRIPLTCDMRRIKRFSHASFYFMTLRMSSSCPDYSADYSSLASPSVINRLRLVEIFALRCGDVTSLHYTGSRFTSDNSLKFFNCLFVGTCCF